MDIELIINSMVLKFGIKCIEYWNKRNSEHKFIVYQDKKRSL